MRYPVLLKMQPPLLPGCYDTARNAVPVAAAAVAQAEAADAEHCEDEESQECEAEAAKDSVAAPKRLRAFSQPSKSQVE